MSKYNGQSGYSRYRGRTPKWKVALAILLVLVILLSGAVLLLQRQLVYDENGRPRLEMPWAAEPETQTEEEAVPELQIQEPEPSKAASRTVLTEAAPLTAADGEAALLAVSARGADGPAVVLRAGGRVYYGSDSAFRQAIRADADTDEALARLTADAAYSLGVFDCLMDPVASQADVERLGLKNTGGYLFYDGNNHNWLDPVKPNTVLYLTSQLTECAAMGFDELLLCSFTFPTVGKLDKIAYSDGDRTETLTALLESFRQALDEAGYEKVQLSLVLPAEMILAGEDPVAGLSLEDLASVADAIYAETEAAAIPALEEAVAQAGTARFVPILPAESTEDSAAESALLLP